MRTLRKRPPLAGHPAWRAPLWRVRLSGELVCETHKPYEALGYAIDDPVNAVVTRNGTVIWPGPETLPLD